MAAKWRVFKAGSVWRVMRPSAAWALRPIDGWSGDFESWDDAIAWTTSPDRRLAWLDEETQRMTAAHRIMWVEGLTL